MYPKRRWFAGWWGPAPGSLERPIADALHDPAAKRGYWSPAAGTYRDGAGKVLASRRRLGVAD